MSLRGLNCFLPQCVIQESKEKVSLTFFLFWPGKRRACRIVFPKSVMEPVPPIVETRNINHWTVEKSQGENFNVFCDLASEVKVCHFHNIQLSDLIEPYSLRKGTTKIMNIRTGKCVGPSLTLATQSLNKKYRKHILDQ